MEKIAIVILNYKNYSMSIECVNKLLAIGVTCKIIVVDNNSPNNSYEVLVENLAKYENVKIIMSKENGGYAKGNNIGIKKAIEFGCEYIAIMNPDVIIETKEVLISLIDSINKNSLGGITALPITNNDYIFSTIGWKTPEFKDLLNLNFTYINKLKNSTQYKSLKIINHKDAVAEVDVMPGCFFILTTKCFKDINYFDEGTFLYYEENIISKKAKSKGYRFGVALNEFYIHNHLAKDTELNNYSYKVRDREIILKSQNHYAKEYLNLNKFKYFILSLSQFTNRYVELPINHIIKKIIRKL